MEEHWLKGKLMPDSAEYSPDFVAGFAAGISKALHGELTAAEIEQMIDDLTRPGPTEEELASAEQRGMELELMQKVLGSFKGASLPASHAVAVSKESVPVLDAFKVPGVAKADKTGETAEAIDRGKVQEVARDVAGKVGEVLIENGKVSVGIDGVNVPIEVGATPDTDFANGVMENGRLIRVVVSQALYDKIYSSKDPPAAFKILARHEFVENVLGKSHAFTSAVDAHLEGTANHALMGLTVPLMTDRQLQLIRSDHPNDPKQEFYQAARQELERREAVAKISGAVHAAINAVEIRDERNRRIALEAALRGLKEQDLEYIPDLLTARFNEAYANAQYASLKELDRQYDTLFRALQPNSIGLDSAWYGLRAQWMVAKMRALSRIGMGAVQQGDLILAQQALEAMERTIPERKNAGLAVTQSTIDTGERLSLMLKAAIGAGQRGRESASEVRKSFQPQATWAAAARRAAIAAAIVMGGLFVSGGHVSAQPVAVVQATNAHAVAALNAAMDRLMSPLSADEWDQVKRGLRLSGTLEALIAMQNDPNLRANLQSAMEYARGINPGRFDELVGSVKHFVVLDVPYQAMAISELGIVILGKQNLEQMRGKSAEYLKGLVLTLIHEGRHVHNAATKAIVSDPNSLKGRAQEEETAYQEALAWQKEMGSDAASLKLQEFITDHIKDNDYQGLVAQFVTGNSEVAQKAIAIGNASDAIAEELAESLGAPVVSRDLEFISAVDAVYEDANGQRVTDPSQWLVVFRHGGVLYKTIVSADGKPVEGGNPTPLTRAEMEGVITNTDYALGIRSAYLKAYVQSNPGSDALQALHDTLKKGISDLIGRAAGVDVTETQKLLEELKGPVSEAPAAAVFGKKLESMIQRPAPTPRKYSRNFANAIKRAVLAAAVFFGAFALPMNADTGPSVQATNGLVHARQAVSVQRAAQPAAVDARVADSTRQELERLLKPIDEKLFGQLHYDLKLETNRKQFDELQNNRDVREMLLSALDYGYRVGGLDFRELLTHARHIVIADLDEHFGALAANGLGTIIVSKAALEAMIKNGERGIKGMNLTFVHELTHLKDFDEGRMSRSEHISQVAPAEKRARLAEYAFAEKSGEDLSAPEFRALKFQIDHSSDDHYRGFVARFISGRSRQDSEAGIRSLPFLADVAKELAAQRKVDDKDIECLSVVLAPQEMESDKKHEAMDVFFRVGNSLYKVHITTDRERGGTSVGMPTEPMSAGEIMNNMFRSGILPEEVQGYADVLGAMLSERIQKKQDTADIRSVFDEMLIKVNGTTALKDASRTIITTTAERWLNTIEEAGPENVTVEEPPVPVDLKPRAPLQKSATDYKDSMEFRAAIGGFVSTAKLALGLAFVATAKAMAAAAVGPATAIGAVPMLLLGGALLTFSIGTYAWKFFPDLKQHVPLLAEMLSFVPRLFAVLGGVMRDSARQAIHSLSKRPVSAGVTAALIGTLSLGESAAVTDGILHVADGIALAGEKAGMVEPIPLWDALHGTIRAFEVWSHSDESAKNKGPARAAAEKFVFNVFSKVNAEDRAMLKMAFSNTGKDADALQDPQEMDQLMHQLADAIEIMMNLPLQKGAYDTDDDRQVWKKAMGKLDAIQNNPFYQYLKFREIEEIPMKANDQSLHGFFLAALPEHLRKEFKNLDISFASPKTYEPLGKPSGYKVTYRRVDRPYIAISQMQAYVLSDEPADAMMDLKRRVFDSNSGTMMRRSKDAQTTAVQTSGDKRSAVAPSADQAGKDAARDGTARPMTIEEEAEVNRLVSEDGGGFVPKFMGFDKENQSFQVEFLSGRTLDSLLKEGKEFGLDTAEGKAKMRQAVFEAFLQWIRKSDGRVIHGDLSPNNVMIVPDESERGYSVKFIDFGVMKNRQEEGKLNLTQILGKIFTLPYAFSDTDFIYSHSSDKLHFFSIFKEAKIGERPTLNDNVFEDFYQALEKVYGEDAARSVVETELGSNNVMKDKSKRDGTYEAVLHAVNGKLSEGVTEAREALNRMLDEDSLETLFSTFGVRAGGVEGDLPSGDNYRNYLRELIQKFPMQMLGIANAEKQADVQKAKEALRARAAQWAAHEAADQIDVFDAINAGTAAGIDSMHLEVINIAAHAEKLRELLKGQKEGTVSAEAVRKFRADLTQAVRQRLDMQRQSGLFKVALLVPVTEQEKLAKLWEILGFSRDEMQEMGNAFMTTPDEVKDSSGKITMAGVVRAAASKIQGLSPRNAAVFTTPEDLQSNWQITQDLIASIINEKGNVTLALNMNALVAVLGPQAAEFKAFAVPGKNGRISVMLYSQEDRDIDSAFESHREAAEKA